MSGSGHLLRAWAGGRDVFETLNWSIPTGLYIVQSSHEPTCYRVGAGGVYGSRSTLFNRLRQHRSKPPSRNDIDWTEYHRRWVPIWAVQFPSCDRLTARLCEALLVGELAAKYPFIPEATGSGFSVPANSAPDVVAFAMSLEPRLEAILERQASRAALRRWVKGSDEGDPSRYLD